MKLLDQEIKTPRVVYHGKVAVEKNLRLHPRFLPTKRLSVGRSFFHVVVVGGGSAEGSRLLEVASFAKFARNWSH